MSTDATRDAAPGIALYSKLFLFIYDWLALGFSCRFIWECLSEHLLDMYNTHVSANHLDIGVGTGYFLDKCTYPAGKPRIALMDLNPNPLWAAGNRIARYHPETYLRNAMEPFDFDAPPFDSIAMMNLLHCLPGTMESKAVAFDNAKALLTPGGTLFGCTILGKGVRKNWYARRHLERCNRIGIMTNLEDDADGLRRGLALRFSKSSVEVMGMEALFWARD